MEEESLNKSFFGKTVKFMSRFLKKEELDEYDEEVEEVSQFDKLIDDLNEKDLVFEDAKQVSSLLEESLKIVKERTFLGTKLKTIEEKILEVECFAKLEKEEADKLKNLLNSFVALKKERNSLVYQLTSFDKNVSKMENLENDANESIDMIDDAEKKQRLLRYDIGQLQGEKISLEDEREMLKLAFKFVERFNIAMVTIFLIAIITLGYTSIFGGAQSWTIISVLILVAIALITAIKYFRIRITSELELNGKRQKRAIQLLNKKTTVYAYYTNFLNFTYKKYKVGSANTLKENIKDYSHYKFLAGRIDSIRRIMYETEGAIEKFLIEKNISSIKVHVEDFARTVNVDDQLELSKSLSKDKLEVETRLNKLDTRQVDIWQIVEDINKKFNKNDLTREDSIGLMIKYYENETNKILDTPYDEDDDEELEVV
jgi:hypothetical protein